MKLDGGEPPDIDETMQHERCVLQIVRRHFARYTPELVAEICGCSRGGFPRGRRRRCARTPAASAPRRSSTRSAGRSTPSASRTSAPASIIQLLLGNIGRPGGGILALRGHANIQGSTDIPTLYNILPGYIPMPHPQSHPTLDEFVELNGPDTGAWGNLRPYIVSLLKAWWGDAATEENDFCFDYLPRIDGDHSHYAMMLKMLDGGVQGMFCVGQNPTVGSANSKLMRLALAKLDWLVVRDFQPIESATVLEGLARARVGRGRARRTSRPRCSSCPPPPTPRRTATSPTPSGCSSGTTRRASRPATPARSCTGSTTSASAIREKLAGLEDPQGPADPRPDLGLPACRARTTSPTPSTSCRRSPDARPTARSCASYDELEDDGSTALRLVDPLRDLRRRRQPGGAPASPAPSRTGSRTSGAGRGPRTSASSTTAPRPTRTASPGLSASATCGGTPRQGKWTGLGDSPGLPGRPRRPDYQPDRGRASGWTRSPGDKPFILHPDGRGWLYAPTGLVDGPLPAHYEPQESPFANPLYAQQQQPDPPACSTRPENPYHPVDGEPGAEVFPFVLTTYRLTEHHTAGGMSRTVPYLAELQPEFFVRGLAAAGRRARPRARRLGDDRHRPRRPSRRG